MIIFNIEVICRHIQQVLDIFRFQHLMILFDYFEHYHHIYLNIYKVILLKNHLMHIFLLSLLHKDPLIKFN